MAHRVSPQSSIIWIIFRIRWIRSRWARTDDTYKNIIIDGTELRLLTSPMHLLGQTQLIGNVQVAASLQTVNKATNKLSLVMIFGGAMTVVGSLLLGMWLSNQTMKPIEAIIEAAEGISTAQDLQKRLPWSGPDDELGQLVDVFNRLMDRLEHLFGVQRRLVADVSHELRTPTDSDSRQPRSDQTLWRGQ